MKFIREGLEHTLNILTEERDGKKQLYIEGPFISTEKPNRNGRIYKENYMLSEVNRYCENFVNQNRALGELGHPDTPNLNLDKVSHLIISLKKENTDWIGKAKIIDTPMGNIAKNLIESGVKLGVSTRGMGSLKSVNGVSIVQDDYKLSAIDIVADPSGAGCFVEGLMEGKEWMLVDGVWTEMQYEQAQKQIRKASKSEIESVSLKIFENYIKTL